MSECSWKSKVPFLTDQSVNFDYCWINYYHFLITLLLYWYTKIWFFVKIVLIRDKVLEWRLKKHILPKFSSIKFGNVSNYLYVVRKLHVISLQKIIDQNLEFYPIPSQVPIWQLIYPSEHELQCNLAINDKNKYR